ncbi:MAG: hypothetical protein F4086_17280 [Gemmatimonadetes bacterium]|nr:hypothetical protein [Gemmatimonadota bacterium]
MGTLLALERLGKVALGPVRSQRTQPQPSHEAFARPGPAQGADQGQERVGARVEQVAVAEGSQRRVRRAGGPERDRPGLFLLTQPQRVRGRLQLLHPGLGVVGRDLSADYVVARAACEQADARGLTGKFERERLGRGDRLEQVLDPEQGALAGARWSHYEQRRPLRPVALDQFEWVESHLHVRSWWSRKPQRCVVARPHLVIVRPRFPSAILSM